MNVFYVAEMDKATDWNAIIYLAEQGGNCLKNMDLLYTCAEKAVIETANIQLIEMLKYQDFCIERAREWLLHKVWQKKNL